MDTKHLDQLAYFIKEQFDITTEEDMPVIFDDYLQDYLTEQVMKYIQKGE